jgi:urocanate hydratase
LIPDLPPSVEPAFFSLTVSNLYRALAQMREAARGQEPDPEPNLGGKLFWAGELDAVGSALVVAGNIAGAATLIASGDSAAQRQAVRDGVIDFLVTSLDEALRILKNEIRKRDTVAVCVAAAPSDVSREMEQRGVRPDVLRDGVLASVAFLEESHRMAGQSSDVLVTWSVESAPAQWLPKIDALAIECLGPQDAVARRWLRLGARYLGRLSQNTRVLAADRALAERMMVRLRQQTDSRAVKVRVRFQVRSAAGSEEFAFGPGAVSEA